VAFTSTITRILLSPPIQGAVRASLLIRRTRVDRIDSLPKFFWQGASAASPTVGKPP
jgi:hypothetical protein